MIGIVDDDGSVRLALATWLRSIGSASHTFASGPDWPRSQLPAHACGLIRGRRMRCLCCTHFVSGLKTLRAIRQRGCAALIISACNHLETRQRAAGIFAPVDDSFADLSLMGVVRGALGAGHGGPAHPAQ